MKKLLVIMTCVSFFGCGTSEDIEPIYPNLRPNNPPEIIDNKKQGVRIQTLLNGEKLKMNYIVYSEWDVLSKYDMKTQYIDFLKSEKNKQILLVEDKTD